MKLRLDSQSIRFRVRKSDTETLAKKGFIEEILHFPRHHFTYRLDISPQDQVIKARASDQSIIVSIPESQAKSWIFSEEVGIYATISTGNEKKILKILIEKDFPCKHRSTADNEDTFEELSKS